MSATKEPAPIRVKPFRVAGIEVRTSNDDESDPATARIGAMWDRFFSDGIMERVPDSEPDAPVYGVYADYESDVNGRYTVTAGVRVPESSNVPEGLTDVSVREGEYLVFEKRGPMPAIVIEAWMEAWRFFEENSGFRRAYATDFEEYRGPDVVAVHVGVERGAVSFEQ